MSTKQQNKELPRRLVERLAEFQKNCPTIELDGKVSFKQTNYRFATLPNILSHIRPVLYDCGLMVCFRMKAGELSCILSTIGGNGLENEVFESSIALPLNNDPKMMGANITYFKRYLLMATLGIVAEEDSSEVDRGAEKSIKPPLSDANFTQAIARINKGQRDVLPKLKLYFSLTEDQENELHLLEVTQNEQ